MSFFRFGFAIAVISTATFALVPACSSSTSSAGGGNDGGGAQDGTTSDVQPGDSGGGDTASGGMCPTYTGSSEYCQALAQHCNACNHQLTSCAIQNFTSYCESLSSAFNQALIPSIKQCAQSAGCAADAGANSCFQMAVAGLTPSQAQQKLANDYCATCPADAGNCAADFYAVSTDGGKSGPGAIILELNDQIATQIDSACTGAAHADGGAIGCSGAFFFCALTVIQGALPKNPCGDAAFAAPIVTNEGAVMIPSIP